jgi:hypothetical protein
MDTKNKVAIPGRIQALLRNVPVRHSMASPAGIRNYDRLLNNQRYFLNKFLNLYRVLEKKETLP